MHASVTFWEATAPVKLPFTSCLYKKLSKIKKKEWYFIAVNTKTDSHLFYTVLSILQLKIIVKVHRVFPSSCK